VPGPPSQLRRGRGLSKRSSGAWGEELALRYLLGRGYELVERNYRTRYGELDLILRKDETLVFVEVKLRRGSEFAGPLEAVDTRKQTTIRSLAEQYLSDRDPAFDTVRFDVVGILVQGDYPRLQHIADAF